MGWTIYCVIKRYKGLFKKKHKGNEHFLITTRPGDQMPLVFQIMGNVKTIDNEDKINGYAALNIIAGGQNIKEVLETVKDNVGDDNLVILDSLNTKNELDKSNTSLIVNIQAKGDYIRGNLYIDNLNILLDKEISIGGNEPVFVIRGDLKIETEDIKLKNLQMVVKKKLSISKSIFNSLKIGKEL